MLQRGVLLGNISSSVSRIGAPRALSSVSDDGYISKSILPTNHFQKSLPRLPIPKLEDTCRRYLDALKPILTEEEFKNSTAAVNSFKDGVGKKLHEHLVQADKQNKNSSYIHQPWVDLYQCDRRSVVLNHNPFLGFVDDVDETQNTQLQKATNLVLSSMRFFRTYRDNLLDPDMYHMNPKNTDNDGFRSNVRWLPQALSWYGAYYYKVFPLCMRQYPMLFQSSRVPKPQRDINVRYPNSRHIVVVHKGHFYAFDVLDEGGHIVDGAQIHSNLNEILSDNRDVNYHSLGYFTFLDRDTWAECRAELEYNNGDLLRVIDSSILVLCLDDYPVAKSSQSAAIAEEDAIPLIKNGLHGQAYSRWYDKSFNLIVTQNGKAAIHFEHSWGDGVSVLRYFNEIHKDSTARPYQPSSGSSGSSLKQLNPVLTDNLKNEVVKARQLFDETVNGFTLDVMKFEGFGKKDLRQLKVSPDSICQLAFQMAHYRFTGKFVGTYESCSTAAFRFGRTETIRPCTNETKACSLAFDRTHSAGLEEMKNLVQACSTKHNNLTKEAATGQGFDRHLFALRNINDKQGGAPLDIFTDPSYAKLNYIILSTSTLVSPALEVGGFAAVVKDGLGLGYAMFDDWFGTQASYYPPHNNGAEFILQLKSVCADLHAVLNDKNFKDKRVV